MASIHIKLKTSELKPTLFSLYLYLFLGTQQAFTKGKTLSKVETEFVPTPTPLFLDPCLGVFSCASSIKL